MSEEEAAGHSRRHANGVHSVLHPLLPSAHCLTYRVQKQDNTTAKASREDLRQTRAEDNANTREHSGEVSDRWRSERTRHLDKFLLQGLSTSGSDRESLPNQRRQTISQNTPRKARLGLAVQSTPFKKGLLINCQEDLCSVQIYSL